MPIMPYIAIPGIPFLRDIIDWYHSTSFITNHNRLINKGSHDPVLIQKLISGSTTNSTAEFKRSRVHLLHRQRLTLEDDPSYRRRPGLQLPGTPLHSLAI